MDWKKLLGSLTASVDEELRLRNAYLAAENRILRQQVPGRVPLSDGDRQVLAEIGQKFGRKALEEIATVATPDTILAWHRRSPPRRVKFPSAQVSWPSPYCSGDRGLGGADSPRKSLVGL